jgi:hypothetical protein
MDLATMRARVREDLQDTDSQNYRWTDDEVDGAIERVVREFSLAYPLQQLTDIATTQGSRELDISSLSKLLKVDSVEFPIDADPRCYQHFRTWGTTLYITDPGDGSDARLSWGKQHTLDASSSTIPEQFEEIIVLGATGYLAASTSVYTVDRATIAGRHATVNFLKWGRARLDRYESKLKAVSRDSRVITRELYTE